MITDSLTLIGHYLSILIVGPAVLAVFSLVANAAVVEDTVRVYVGTYTTGGSEGIYLLELDLRTGSVSPAKLAAPSENPSFLAVHPSGAFLYAVNEIGNFAGGESGGVSAFRIDSVSGGLELLNRQTTLGTYPCYIVVDPTGRNVLVANYGGGSVASLPIRSDGSLGEPTAFIQHEGSSANPERQEAPHAHSVNVDADSRYALAADLGLDKVLVYRFDPEDGTLKPNDPASESTKPGAGPRHLSFHPSGRYVYVVNELDLTVAVFAYDPVSGTLEALQTISTIPGEADDNYSTAEIRVHPSGKFLYASNRGHDSIVAYGIDPESGRLTLIEHEPTQGRTPRNFVIDPSGEYLLAANQHSDSVVVFRIDQDSGALTPTGHSTSVPRPVCLRFL